MLKNVPLLLQFFKISTEMSYIEAYALYEVKYEVCIFSLFILSTFYCKQCLLSAYIVHTQKQIPLYYSILTSSGWWWPWRRTTLTAQRCIKTYISSLIYYKNNTVSSSVSPCTLCAHINRCHFTFLLWRALHTGVIVVYVRLLHYVAQKVHFWLSFLWE